MGDWHELIKEMETAVKRLDDESKKDKEWKLVLNDGKQKVQNGGGYILGPVRGRRKSEGLR